MYYLMSETDDSILEALHEQPTAAQLAADAEYFNCPIYIIKGERIGETVYPPEKEQEPKA